jgi:hypothetical protein
VLLLNGIKEKKDFAKEQSETGRNRTKEHEIVVKYFPKNHMLRPLLYYVSL